MKISRKSRIDKGSKIKGVDGKNKKATTPKVEKAQESISVEISENVREVSRAKKMLSTVPDMRVNVVSGLKGSVGEGTYHRESKKVAKKLVDESIEIAKKKKTRKR